MIQQTSVLSYKQIMQDESTDTIRNNIFEIINNCPGITRNGIQRIYLAKKHKFLKTGTVTGRVNELIKEEKIVAAGTVKDRLTNTTVQTLYPVRRWI